MAGIDLGFELLPAGGRGEKVRAGSKSSVDVHIYTPASSLPGKDERIIGCHVQTLKSVPAGGSTQIRRGKTRDIRRLIRRNCALEAREQRLLFVNH